NTFLSTSTSIEMFREGSLLFGEEIRRHYAGGVHEISGFLEVLANEGMEAVPLFAASAPPSGLLTRETCEWLMNMMFDTVHRAGPLEGYLVAPHGANAGAGEYRDLDGYWL